jgi:hypothetical protein
MIPEFEPDGRLPAGIHACGWNEIECRFSKGPKRLFLLQGLKRASRALKKAGCRRLYLDGSFVTAKEQPTDFDGCWSTEGVAGELVDPVLLDFKNGRASQKLKFGGELFLAELTEGGTGQLWLDFFQIDKETGGAKGILLIDLTQDIP